MSSRIALAALLSAVLAAAASTGAQSQEIRDYERRVDSLSAIATRAKAALKAFDDSVARDARRLDTAAAGPITMLAERPLSSFARAVAESSLVALTPSVGQAMRRLARHSFVIRRHRPESWERPLPSDTEVVLSSLTSSGAEALRWRGPQRLSVIASTLQDQVLRELYGANPGFLHWLSNQIPRDSVTTVEWMSYRLALVSSTATVSRRCFDGDLRACAIALQVVPAPDPVTEWFDARTRRRIVDESRAVGQRVDRRAQLRCLGGSDSACTALLRRYPATDLPVPFPAKYRVGLARLAITIGDPGASERLLEPGEPAERIAAAARVPVDSLLRVWQQRVRTARAPSRDLSFEIASVSVIWILGLGALSLRSSRWR